LLKKLSGHVISELRAGKTQEQLVAEALNVANLFEGDLAHLSPTERDALSFVARYAPIQAGEVTERYQAGVVQSLLNQRLIVQVGEKLDTYWDTFRDYLNNGSASIEDSYILRQTPRSVARLLSAVMSNNGEVAVADLASKWNTSENVVWNVARELRQLGLALYKPNYVQLVPEILLQTDAEGDVRKRVAQALRRHRAFSSLAELADRTQGPVTTAQFARQLEIVFPAVEVTSSTWTTYARVFLLWFEYAGLIEMKGSVANLAPDGASGKGMLTTSSGISRGEQTFPTMTSGPCIEMLAQLRDSPRPLSEIRTRADQRVLGQLLALKAVTVDESLVRPVEGIVDAAGIVPERLHELLRRVVGGEEALDLLKTDSSAGQFRVGSVVRDAHQVAWSDATTSLAGKAFRGWAKVAGVTISRGKD
jgi:hypothetical protein